MSIETYSAFTYGHTITDDNKFININEGSGEIACVIEIGSYSLGEFVNKVSEALNNSGSLEYDVSIDRNTRKITISSTSAFDLLISSGANASSSAYELIGFTGADQTGLLTYEGDESSGEYYQPQNILQSYIDFTQSFKTTNASVNQSASGVVEVVSYGKIRFMNCNIAPIRDGENFGFMLDDLQAEQNILNFINYASSKAKIEFIPDVNNPSTFTNCLLESTRESKQGVDFDLKPYQKLFKWYQSGALTFRELK